MKILWFTWKDLKNPLAGGAEIVNEEIAKRLVKDGYEVVFITSGYKDCINEENIDGYKVIRVGSRWTVYYEAYKYYKKNLIGWADLVIDEINTIPFFCEFYVKEKNILFIHQLAREIWFYQMFFPLNIIGYLLEPLYLKLLKEKRAITVSNSTKNDLLKIGFKDENVEIISEGIDLKPLENINDVVKYEIPTILSLGSIREMKRTEDIIFGFENAKNVLKDLKLIVAGDSNSKYGKKVLKTINDSKYVADIECLGRVTKEKKTELMQKSHLICVTSVKEGWGLIVTEAGSQGTPSLVYNIDGLRDAVKLGETGFITNENNAESLGEKIIEIFRDKEKYDKIREAAHDFSKDITFERCYEDFIKIINKT